MKTFIIDNSYYGVLSAVFYSFKNSDFPSFVTDDNYQTQIGETFIEIPINEENASRVDKRLKSLLKTNNYTWLKNAHKSGTIDKLNVIFNYIVHILKAQNDVTDNFSNPDIFRYYRLISALSLEVHRFLGFIRFTKTEQGIFYACFSPDNDIAELILPHFISRFKSMAFILHDLKHDVIIGYNGKEYKVVKQKIPKLKVDGDDIPKLFKEYYQTVKLKDRLKLKQMTGYMPRRYHKYMPEKNELLS